MVTADPAVASSKVDVRPGAAVTTAPPMAEATTAPGTVEVRAAPPVSEGIGMYGPNVPQVVLAEASTETPRVSSAQVVAL